MELPSAPLNKRKVLIIEDDNDVREFLKEEVGQYFEVVAEADGPSGLERARTYDADLIICDVLMPGMTGFEVTRKLKNDLIFYGVDFHWLFLPLLFWLLRLWLARPEFYKPDLLFLESLFS